MSKISRPLRRAANAFATLGQRVCEVGHAGLTLWSDAGDRAVKEISTRVTANSSANRDAQANLAGDLEAMLQDGVIDASEMARLKAHKRALRLCVVRSEDSINAVTI